MSEFATAFEAGADGRKRVDVLLTPTAPLPPLTLRAALASALPDSDDRDDGAAAAEVYVNDVMTVPANLASLPALSLPVDTTSISIEGQIVQVKNRTQYFQQIEPTGTSISAWYAPPNLQSPSSRCVRGPIRCPWACSFSVELLTRRRCCE